MIVLWVDWFLAGVCCLIGWVLAVWLFSLGGLVAGGDYGCAAFGGCYGSMFTLAACYRWFVCI